MTGHDPGDPFPTDDPAPAGDPAVSRVTYALLDLGIDGRVLAEAVLEVLDGVHGLSEAQQRAVLAGIGRAPEQRRGICEVCGEECVEDPPGLWRHVTAGKRTHDAWPRLTPVGPGYIPPEERT